MNDLLFDDATWRLRWLVVNTRDWLPRHEVLLPRSSAGEPHLRSVEAVVGHRVHLRDGVVGHVEELLVDDADWSIRHIRVDTCKWRPGDKVLLAPRLVREIDWRGWWVRFDVGRREIAGDRAHRDVIWMRSRSDGGTHGIAGAPDQAQAGLSAGRRE